MTFTYEYFADKLNAKIKSDESFIYELLVTVVKKPNRYTGIFRLSNAKTKLIQNVTQSREIKFGDFMEEIVTDYIAAMGYRNLNKSIGTDEDGNALSADQVFMKDDTVYLVEQKIRDDHDSTKKRGQFQNFRKKYLLLKSLYAGYNINATMWFIDGSLKKNKKYYISEAMSDSERGVEINIFYGRALFDVIFPETDIWEEICAYLIKNKQERNNEILYIPDFDTSEEIYIALKKLKRCEPTLYRKLISTAPAYVQLRNELFPTEYNLNRVREYPN